MYKFTVLMSTDIKIITVQNHKLHGHKFKSKKIKSKSCPKIPLRHSNIHYSQIGSVLMAYYSRGL